MLKIEFGVELFSFDSPLCFLGNEEDFQKLSKEIVKLTNLPSGGELKFSSLDFVKFEQENIDVVFKTSIAEKKYCQKNNEGHILFELDSIIWDRLFVYFVMCSWNKCTHYLNEYENGLNHFDLEQEYDFVICSEF